MKARYKNVVEVFNHYERIALEKVKDKEAIILKTDLFNESEKQVENKNILKVLSPYIYKGYGIEIDSKIYKQACETLHGLDNLDLQVGSINHIPVDDNAVDIIFDFSTIDHVKSYRDALKEYSRILKPSGEVIIIVWLCDNEDHLTYPGQYCFNQKKFEYALTANFNIKSSQLLLEKLDKVHNVKRRLIEYDLGILTK